jgi:hypothetical protein
MDPSIVPSRDEDDHSVYLVHKNFSAMRRTFTNQVASGSSRFQLRNKHASER